MIVSGIRTVQELLSGDPTVGRPITKLMDQMGLLRGRKADDVRSFFKRPKFPRLVNKMQLQGPQFAFFSLDVRNNVRAGIKDTTRIMDFLESATEAKLTAGVFASLPADKQPSDFMDVVEWIAASSQNCRAAGRSTPTRCHCCSLTSGTEAK